VGAFFYRLQQLLSPVGGLVALIRLATVIALGEEVDHADLSWRTTPFRVRALAHHRADR